VVEILVILAVLLVAALLAYRFIFQVPSLLHTPLMSAMNALSGIAVVGALFLLAEDPGGGYRFLTGVAVVLATVNVVGGFGVTEKMLRMFRREDTEENSEKGERLPWS